MEEEEGNEGRARRFSHHRKDCYQGLLNRLDVIQESDDVGLHTANELHDILKEVNLVDRQCDIDDRVVYTDETLLGSDVLSSASALVVKCLESMNASTMVYEPAKFAEKLLTNLKKPEEEFQPKDWLKLLGDACEILPELPNFSFVYVAVDPKHIPEPKGPKEHTTRDANEVEKTKPQAVDNIEGDQVERDNVNFLQKVLKDAYQKNDSKPIPYFDFVIDSKDFGATVENIFYCAFLMRDGKAGLGLGEDGKPTLRPMGEIDLEQFRSSGGVNTQMITSISMGDWEVLAVKEGIVETYKKQQQLSQ